MKLTTLAVVVAVASACGVGTQGPPGPEGETGPEGPSGPVGPQGPAGGGTDVLTWVDASGTILGREDAPVYVEGGHLWTYDPETADIDPNVHELARVYFSGPCTGTAMVEARLPGIPWRQLGETNYRLRLASTQSARFTYNHVLDLAAGGACVSLSGTLEDATPLLPLQPANIPTPAVRFTAPLHQEMRAQ